MSYENLAGHDCDSQWSKSTKCDRETQETKYIAASYLKEWMCLGNSSTGTIP
jgi:hypothetical protein